MWEDGALKSSTQERREKSMSQEHGARDAAQAADLLVTVAASLNERLALTAGELARSQTMLREASAEMMTAFRGAADRIVAAQRSVPSGTTDRRSEYGVVLDHLYRAVEH